MKKFYKTIIGLLITAFSTSAFANTNKHNLERYWYYKQRLHEKFMVLSDQHNLQGVNLPASHRDDEKKTMSWGDTTWFMGFYLGSLATEYRLLKDNGEDTTATLMELKGALGAIDRIDLVAETYYGGAPKMNGFFIRDDVDADFLNRHILTHPSFAGITIEAPTKPGRVAEMSQDQVWSLLVGYSLVKKLVDDPTVKQQVVGTVSRMVGSLHHCKRVLGKNGCIRVWEILNPVTGHVVERGGLLIEASSLSYGFGEAASFITEKDMHYGYSASNLLARVFQLAQTAYKIQFKQGHKYNIHGIAALTAVGDIAENFVVVERSAYSFLKRLTKKTGLFEHLPLVYRLIHGSEDLKAPNGEEVKRLVNIAPDCGPTYKNPISEWSSDNRLGSPWADDWSGDYNGIDYLMLHNLVLLNYPHELGNPRFYRINPNSTEFAQKCGSK